MGTRRGLLFGWLGMLMFSGTVVATRFAVRELDATFIALGRALVAAVLAACVLAARRAPWPTGEQWRRIALVSAGVVVGFPWLITLALRTMPAAHGAVIVGLLPMATSVLAVIRGGERPSPAFWVASAAGLIGILVFASTRGAHGLGQADLLALAAVVLAGIGYCEGGLLAREMPAAHVICWALVLAAPFLALPTAWTLVRTGAHAGAVAWLCFGYVSVLSMFLGFFAFYRGMAEAGIARVSQIQLAQPVCSLVWSGLLLGERIDAATALTALFVVGCVLVTSKTRVRVTYAVPEAP
ncbi:MAG: DMT family transporter [Myxococcaceae bacterium]